MLYDVKLPRYLCERCLITATYLLNRSPTKAVQEMEKTLAEIWYQKNARDETFNYQLPSTSPQIFVVHEKFKAEIWK